MEDKEIKTFEELFKALKELYGHSSNTPRVFIDNNINISNNPKIGLRGCKKSISLYSGITDLVIVKKFRKNEYCLLNDDSLNTGTITGFIKNPQKIYNIIKAIKECEDEL